MNRCSWGVKCITLNSSQVSNVTALIQLESNYSLFCSFFFPQRTVRRVCRRPRLSAPSGPLRRGWHTQTHSDPSVLWLLTQRVCLTLYLKQGRGRKPQKPQKPSFLFLPVLRLPAGRRGAADIFFTSSLRSDQSSDHFSILGADIN